VYTAAWDAVTSQLIQ